MAGAKRKCNFNVNLQKEFTDFNVVEENRNEAFCKICRSKISIANKGAYDLKQHILSKKHREKVQNVASSSKLNSFFVQQYSPLEFKVLAVEGALAYHTIKHHFRYLTPFKYKLLLTKIKK